MTHIWDWKWVVEVFYSFKFICRPLYLFFLFPFFSALSSANVFNCSSVDSAAFKVIIVFAYSFLFWTIVIASWCWLLWLLLKLYMRALGIAATSAIHGEQHEYQELIWIASDRLRAVSMVKWIKLLLAASCNTLDVL